MNERLIIAVCRGNIGRSPFAQAIINQELGRAGLQGEFTVLSRGLQGTEVDPEPVRFPNLTYYGQIYEDARPVLDTFNVDMSNHASRSIERADAERARLLLALDDKTQTGIEKLFPDQAYKIRLLSEMVGKNEGIVDPDGVSGPEQQALIYTEIRDIVVGGFSRIIETARSNS